MSSLLETHWILAYYSIIFSNPSCSLIKTLHCSSNCPIDFSRLSSVLFLNSMWCSRADRIWNWCELKLVESYWTFSTSCKRPSSCSCDQLWPKLETIHTNRVASLRDLVILDSASRIIWSLENSDLSSVRWTGKADMHCHVVEFFVVLSLLVASVWPCDGMEKSSWSTLILGASRPGYEIFCFIQNVQ